MTLPAEKHAYTVDEYLEFEFQSPTRHEYRQGKIVEMSGTTFNHSLIATNIIRALGTALKGGPCTVLDSNLRVRTPRKALFVYPDVTVICGPPVLDYHKPGQETATNPKLIVEVLSPSTEAYDRGDKFEGYREIESFEEYVLVAQDRPGVQTHFRQPGGTWLLTPFRGMEAVALLRSLSVSLPLTEIYAGVNFPIET